MRRAAFSQYFSKSKVSELQARISKKVELLKERMLSWEDSGELLDLYDAFSALTLGRLISSAARIEVVLLMLLRGHQRIRLRQINLGATQA